jgi:beta-glucosidase
LGGSTVYARAVTNAETGIDLAALAKRFPPDFAWGFAASAYQVEGAAAEDGRGRSIWDTLARVPDAIADGQTGDVACDHYHRYPEDVALMATIGVKAHRFSISWPRIQPDGTGAVNQRGLDFYDRLVDALLAAGIKPLVNLFHWDLPEGLQDDGGFADPRIVRRFAEYASLVATRLHDRVSDWMTFNEPAVFAYLGHADGIHAPALRDWPTALRVADHELRAHAAAVEALRSHVKKARIGIAIDVNQVGPATDSDRDRRAAAQWSSARDAWFLDPLFGRGDVAGQVFETAVVAAGVPLTGYHVWSLLDNFEWSLGYTRRFGLVHVDFANQRRTLKDSARWYGRLIAAAS